MHQEIRGTSPDREKSALSLPFYWISFFISDEVTKNSNNCKVTRERVCVRGDTALLKNEIRKTYPTMLMFSECRGHLPANQKLCKHVIGFSGARSENMSGVLLSQPWQNLSNLDYSWESSNCLCKIGIPIMLGRITCLIDVLLSRKTGEDRELEFTALEIFHRCNGMHSIILWGSSKTKRLRYPHSRFLLSGLRDESSFIFLRLGKVSQSPKSSPEVQKI